MGAPHTRPLRPSTITATATTSQSSPSSARCSGSLPATSASTRWRGLTAAPSRLGSRRLSDCRSGAARGLDLLGPGGLQLVPLIPGLALRERGLVRIARPLRIAARPSEDEGDDTVVGAGEYTVLVFLERQLLGELERSFPELVRGTD